MDVAFFLLIGVIIMFWMAVDVVMRRRDRSERQAVDSREAGRGEL